MLTIDKVKKAETLLKDVIRKTDLIYAAALSTGAEIYLKSENLQKKDRPCCRVFYIQ